MSECNLCNKCSQNIPYRQSRLSPNTRPCDKNCPGRKKREPPKPRPRPTTYKVASVSSSNSGLNFMEPGDPRNDEGDRVVRYREGAGTSFAAHLLRKSQPMIAHNLSQKLKFKRDSEAGITGQESPIRGLTATVAKRPSFFDGVSSDVGRFSMADGDLQCPPVYEKNLLKKPFLTNDRVRRGLQYVQVCNQPHRPPPTPVTKKREIQDPCGRVTHNPKLKRREQCKRLCEAPSMTNELDYLFKEYVQRCVGNEKSEACRLLHHAPSPYHGEKKRSILKDHHDDILQELHHHKGRKSSGLGHVHFDSTVENLSTITKVKGLAAAVKLNPARMKFHPQVDRRIGTVDMLRGEDNVEERYPPHLETLKKSSQRATCSEAVDTKVPPPIDPDKLENKTARQDLARIYFTNEATRLMACSNLGAWEANLNVKEPEPKRSPSIPHFFMERLLQDMETSKQKKEFAKIQKLKNEMDAFDKVMLNKSPNEIACSRFASSASRFDPRQQDPERSLFAVKQKMEKLKRQRKKELKATTNRYRCRKVYFRQMMSSFDIIEEDLVEYASNILPRKSNSEKKLIQELNNVANHKLFQEYTIQFDAAKLERISDTAKAAQDVIQVLVENALKIERYKEAAGEDPPKNLPPEWRDDDFAAIYASECADNIEAAKKTQKVGSDIMEVLIDVAIKSSEYRDETGENPPQSVCFDWRSEGFAEIYGLECPWLDETKQAAEQFVENVLKTVNDLVLQICEFRTGYGRSPSEALYQTWLNSAFDFLTDPDCMGKLFSPEMGEQLAIDISTVMMDTVFNLKEFGVKDADESPQSMCKKWMDAGFNLDVDCLGIPDDSGEQVVADIINVGLLDVVYKSAEFKKGMGHKPPERLWQEWRDEGFDSIVDSKCMEGIREGVGNDKFLRTILDIGVDVAMQSSDYKGERGETPSKGLAQEWRDSAFNLLEVDECMAHMDDDKSEDVVRDILEVIVDVAMNSSEYKSANGGLPSVKICDGWKEEKFAELKDADCLGIKGAADTEAQLLNYIIKIVKDVSLKVNKYRTFMGGNPPQSVYQEWRNAAFSVLNRLEISGKLNRKIMTDSLVADLVGVVLEVVVRMGDLIKKRASQRPCMPGEDEGLEDPTCPAEESGELVSRQILDALVTVAVKASEEKASGHDPTDEEMEEWMDDAFQTLDNAGETPQSDESETLKDLVCFGQQLNEEDVSAVTEFESQDVASNLMEVLLDLTVKTSGYRAATSRQPRQGLVEEWMNIGFARQNELVCWRKREEAFTGERVGRLIVEVLLEVAFRISEYKAEHGEDPPQSLIDEWKEAAYDSITVEDVISKLQETANMACKEGDDDKDGTCPSEPDKDNFEAEPSEGRQSVQSSHRAKCFFPLHLVDATGKPVREKILPECQNIFNIADASLCPTEESDESGSESPVESISECIKKDEPPPPPPSVSNTIVSHVSTGFDTEHTHHHHVDEETEDDDERIEDEEEEMKDAHAPHAHVDIVIS